MLIILSGIAWMVFHLNGMCHRWFTKISVWCLFAWGPTMSIISTLFVRRIHVLATLFETLCTCGHGVLYLTYYIASFSAAMSWRPVEQETADYTRGPNGQQFEDLIGEDTDEWSGVAKKVKSKVRSTVRSSILMSAILWFFSAIVVTHSHIIGHIWYDLRTHSVTHSRRLGLDIDAQPRSLLLTQAVSVSWPSPMVSPRFLACAGGQAFAANAYQVFRVP